MSEAKNTPWKREGGWFVSPWNYAPEVTAGCSFPPRIQIHDVTLRDGEQQAAVVFTAEEKIRIAEKLAEIGVHRIEAGMPAVSPQDRKAIEEIAKRNLGPKIFAFARCMVDDIKLAADCGVDGVIVEIPSSEHLIEKAYRWPLQKAIDLSVEATLYAKKLGLYTVFFPIDASRADLSWVLELLQTVASQGHMDALVVVDTFGGLSPLAVPYLVRRFKEKINKPLEAHFHDDFGLAAANTLIALACGVEVAHTTIAGIGERAGNAPFEHLVLALLTMCGIDLGLKYEGIYELSRLVQKMTGFDVPPNRGVVGDRIFDVESGIVASWLVNCMGKDVLEVFPVHWQLVGHRKPRIVLGKNSGVESLRYYLSMLGVSANDEQLRSMVALVKERSFEKHGLIELEDFMDIISEVWGARM